MTYSSELEEAKVQLETAQREVATVTAGENAAAEALEEAGQKLRQLKAEAERLRELQDSGDQRAQVRALDLGVAAAVVVPVHAVFLGTCAQKQHRGSLTHMDARERERKGRGEGKREGTRTYTYVVWHLYRFEVAETFENGRKTPWRCKARLNRGRAKRKWVCEEPEAGQIVKGSEWGRGGVGRGKSAGAVAAEACTAAAEED